MSQGFARGTPGATGQQGPAGAPGAGASGAHLFELAPITSLRFLGRQSPGSGVIEELTTPTAVAMLPVFTLAAKGLVPPPSGSSAGLFLRDDSTWAAAGSAGRPSGVTLGEQAVAPPFTVQGRFTLGTGTREDLAPGQVASLIGGGWGSGLQLLAAPTGGVQGRYLGDNGQWSQVPVSSQAPSGITLGQVGALSPLRVLGRFTAGSGTTEQLSGDQVASMIGKFAGTGLGLVPTPTGGALGRMLRDDGQWATVSLVASGVTLSQQGDLSPLRMVGRFTLGSGSPEQLTQGQVASLLPVFTATGTPGLVPAPSAAGSGMFLRDDGKWSSPTGLGNGQFALMAPMTIKARTGPTGTPEDLVPSAVATMLPLFNDIHKGLVPGSGGGTANFLRSDGSWAAPSVAAGVSGVAFAQLQDISAPRFVGRFAGSGSMQELQPLSAASMLPRMLGSGFGLVVAPTGGVAGQFLRDDGTFVGVPSNVATGLTFAQQANLPPLSFNGRFTLGTGVTESVSNYQAASMLPLFYSSGTSKGLVMGPSAVSGNFLKDDGSWAAPAAGSASGIANAQLLPMPPFTLKGRITLGSGIPEDLTQAQVASLLPRFVGSGAGQVPAPTGGNVRSFLRDDGQWQIPLASGIANAALGAMLAPSVKGRFTLGSGVPEDLTGAQVASMLPLLSTTTAGLAPMPTAAAASGYFLDSKGLYSAPTGLNNGQFALMPPSTIKGTAGITGLPQDLVGSAVGTLLPLFNSIDKGLVPGSAGGTTAFLRADGAWAAPSVGGGVSGIAFNQITDVSPFKLLGRGSVSSGTIAELSPLTVASLLPPFLGTGVGMVIAPTGGASGYFLTDNGSFYNLLPSKERLIGNVGSGIGSGFRVGSATVDFSIDPNQSLNLFARTQFTLTPPTRHRHTQLRMVVSASGHAPTFFGTMVKWAGGSGATPAWNTASGAVNFANFFYDGTIMWGQAGVGFG